MGQLCSTPPKNMTKASVALSQEYKGVLFESINGDIIDAEAEAIINAANSQLTHNSGLGNSLIAKGGQTIQEESNKIREKYEAEIPIGTAVVTGAGNLRAKYIIHVISPIWNGGSNNEETKLAECVLNALTEAETHKLKTIAVPSLDGGVFGFPRETAAKIIVQECVQYIDAHQPTSIQTIKFINTNAVTVSAFKTAIQHSLLKVGALGGESVTLAREDAETKENNSLEKETQEETVVTEKAAEPVEQRPEVQETVSEEKREEVPVPEVVVEQVAEKAVEQAIEQAVEQVVEEKAAEPVVEQVIHEEKPVEQVAEPVIEEKTAEPVVEEQAVAEPEPVVEEQVIAEPEPVVEEKQEEAPAAEEEKPVEQVAEPVVEEQAAEPVVEEQVIAEPEPVVEEKQEEAPAAEEEKPVEQVAEPVVEEEKAQEVAADETKTEETQETQETKETEAEEKGEEAEAATEEAEQGGKKKKNKKKGKRN